MAIDSVVIGFGFRARSGKDTAVSEIIKQRGLIQCKGIPSSVEGEADLGKGTGTQTDRYDIRRYAFADAVKREVNEAAARYGNMFKMLVSERATHLVQANGNFLELPDWVQFDTEADMTDPMCPLGKQRSLLQFWGTEYRRSIDPDYWVRQLAQQIELEKPQYALLTDMRFPNEMEFVLQYGETVRVDRDGLPPATHASETALADVSDEDWSIILENNGTLEEFLEGAVTTFDELITNFPYGHNL